MLVRHRSPLSDFSIPKLDGSVSSPWVFATVRPDCRQTLVRPWLAHDPCATASTPFLPLLYAEIIRSHFGRSVAQGLLVRFRAPSGNSPHDDVSIFDLWRVREQLVVPREAIDVVFHDAQVGYRRGEVGVHHRGEVAVEVVGRDVYVECFGGARDLHGLPDAVPDGVDDRDVHRLFLEIRQELAHAEEGLARADRVSALLADVRERPGIVGVELDPEEVEVFEGADDADKSLRPGVEIQVQQDLYIRARAIAKRLEMGPDAPDERPVDVEAGGEGCAEARHPGAYRPLFVAKHVRLERGGSQLAGVLTRPLHTVEIRDGRGIERGWLMRQLALWD